MYIIIRIVKSSHQSKLERMLDNAFAKVAKEQAKAERLDRERLEQQSGTVEAYRTLSDRLRESEILLRSKLDGLYSSAGVSDEHRNPICAKRIREPVASGRAQELSAAYELYDKEPAVGTSEAYIDAFIDSALITDGYPTEQLSAVLYAQAQIEDAFTPDSCSAIDAFEKALAPFFALAMDDYTYTTYAHSELCRLVGECSPENASAVLKALCSQTASAAGKAASFAAAMGRKDPVSSERTDTPASAPLNDGEPAASDNVTSENTDMPAPDKTDILSELALLRETLLAVSLSTTNTRKRIEEGKKALQAISIVEAGLITALRDLDDAQQAAADSVGSVFEKRRRNELEYAEGLVTTARAFAEYAAEAAKLVFYFSRYTYDSAVNTVAAQHSLSFFEKSTLRSLGR